jgi:hypothetical protein
MPHSLFEGHFFPFGGVNLRFELRLVQLGEIGSDMFEKLSEKIVVEEVFEGFGHGDDFWA